MSNQSAELVLDAQRTLGEGALWHNDVLYWLDIEEGVVMIFDPSSGENRIIPVGQKVGTLVPRRQGGLALAMHHGFALLDLETEEVTMLKDPESDNPANRFNDGKCDPAGRFWAGTMAVDEGPPVGSMYVMGADHSVRKAFDQICISNGIVWSHDHKTMYFIDSPMCRVDAFDYDIETGNVSNRRTTVTIDKDQYGWPDGSTLDSDGNLWIAMWGGSMVTQWNPVSGEILNTIPLPTSAVTSVAFGGSDLGDLYITTANRDHSEDDMKAQPHAGGLFMVRPGVVGVPAYEFAG